MMGFYYFGSWFNLLFPLIVIPTSIWVFFDARSLGVRKGLARDLVGLFDMTPLGWSLSCLFVVDCRFSDLPRDAATL